jgi:hypothetical protein
MSNKKVLSQATRGLNKAKAPSKSRDIIYDPMGQWAHPGQNTRIPGGDITMQGVPYPVWAQPNVGQPQMMQPGQEYNFPEADYVDEYPQMKRGGYMKGLVPMPKPSNKGLASKAYSRSLDATNRLFTENYLFKKPKDKRRKVFDPKAKYYAEGGFIETELTDEEIQAYKDGGYIVEDISIPTLEYQKGGASSDDPWKKIMRTTQKKIIESGKVKKDNSDWRRANDEAPNLNYQNTNQNTTVKKLSPEDKKRQENFNKNFGVEGKDNYTKLKDKVQENLKLWAGERDNYGDYDDGEWKSAVEDLTTKEMNKAFDNKPDNQIAPKMNKDAPRETVAEYRKAKQDWDKKNFLEKIGTSLGHDLGILDRGNPYKEFLPAPVAGVPQMADDISGMGRSEFFTKGAQYLMPKVKQAANYFFKEEGGNIDNNQMLELQEGGIYTYAGRKDSKYKKDSEGNWLISNKSTGNKFIPIKDPTGERTVQLNKSAKSENSIDLSNITPDRSGSESTDTQGYKLLNKQLSEDKLNKQYQSRNEKQAAVDSYVESIKKQKPFGKDTKKNKEYQDKAISDIRNKFIENPDQAYSIAYNSLTNDSKHSVKALPKGSVKTGPSAYDILTNPFDAFKYSVMTGDVSNMPANYNKFKRAGINPLDSQGGNLVGDALNMGYNPIDMVDKVYYHTKQGDGWSAALNAARALPMLKGLSKTAQGAKVLSGLNSKVVQPLEKVLNSPMPGLVKATQKSSPLLQKLAKNATINNALTGRALTSAALQVPDLYDKGSTLAKDFNKNNALEFLETAADVGLTTMPYTKIPGLSKRIDTILDKSTNPYWFSKAYWGAADPDKKFLEYSTPIAGGKVFDAISLLKTLPVGKRKGGESNSMETELTDAEIEQLRKQGYVIELI